MFDYERAVVGRGLKLNVAADAGQTEPPETIIVGGVCLMHLHDLDGWERRANSADNGFDVVRLAHGSGFSERVASPRPNSATAVGAASVKLRTRLTRPRLFAGVLFGAADSRLKRGMLLGVEMNFDGYTED